MRAKRAFVIGIVAAALVVAGGAGIAQAVSGGDEEQLSGPAAQQAARAALEAAGGGEVLEVEAQDDDGAGLYEVEVRRPDGSTIEVQLDAGFRPVGTVLDDDGEGEDAEGADD